MAEKIKLAVLFGGQSGEHEVSLMSAASVLRILDPSKYRLYPIGITKDGQWKAYDGPFDNIEDGTWEADARPAVLPGDPAFGGFFLSEDPARVYALDVVFPVLHGPRGEDGTVQGLLELSGIPYVGCGVLASAAGMDKGTAKAIFASLNLPQGPYTVFYLEEYRRQPEQILDRIETDLGYPCFVKPANMGSSVGITKAHDRTELKAAAETALRYDQKIVAEAFISCREIECAVLGNQDPKASIVGEIIPSREFYDYEAKYFDGGVSELLIPAPIPPETAEEVRRLAVAAYRALDCSGMARVDFFVQKTTGKVYVNEINTIPGFTKISMYPKLWAASGCSYAALLDTLIALALQRHGARRR